MPNDPVVVDAATPAPRTPSDAITPKEKDPDRHQQFLYRMTDGPINLLFLGDSMLDLWPKLGEYSWLRFAQHYPADFGVMGDATENVLWRIENGELEGIHPRVLVLLIGTNNIGLYPTEKPEWAAAGVAKIVQIVRQKLPMTKILLLAIFPREEKDNPIRQRVEEVNQIICHLGEDPMVTYLDIGHIFLDPDGNLIPGITVDGLHPSGRGYDAWYAAMMPTLSQMLRRPPRHYRMSARRLRAPKRH
ncbi:hypothetical protein KQI84_01095 [bacterium]|nr:hypothetical protein [bacterium]